MSPLAFAVLLLAVIKQRCINAGAPFWIGGFGVVRALARGLAMTSCVVIPAGGVLTGLAAGESVVPLNCLVFFLPWWLYDAI